MLPSQLHHRNPDITRFVSRYLEFKAIDKGGSSAWGLSRISTQLDEIGYQSRISNILLYEIGRELSRVGTAIADLTNSVRQQTQVHEEYYRSEYKSRDAQELLYKMLEYLAGKPDATSDQESWRARIFEMKINEVEFSSADLRSMEEKKQWDSTVREVAAISREWTLRNEEFEKVYFVYRDVSQLEVDDSTFIQKKKRVSTTVRKSINSRWAEINDMMEGRPLSDDHTSPGWACNLKFKDEVLPDVSAEAFPRFMQKRLEELKAQGSTMWQADYNNTGCWCIMFVGMLVAGLANLVEPEKIGHLFALILFTGTGAAFNFFIQKYSVHKKEGLLSDLEEMLVAQHADIVRDYERIDDERDKVSREKDQVISDLKDHLQAYLLGKPNLADEFPL